MVLFIYIIPADLNNTAQTWLIKELSHSLPASFLRTTQTKYLHFTSEHVSDHSALLKWWSHCCLVVTSPLHKHTSLSFVSVFAINLPLTYADLCSAWLIGGLWGTRGFDIFKRQQHQNLSDVFCFPFNFSRDGEATWSPCCMLSPLYLLVGFFQHDPVLLSNHTVNTVGFLEVLECHSVPHQRHQLSTTTHTHIQR